jgi:hypothetical protein
MLQWSKSKVGIDQDPMGPLGDPEGCAPSGAKEGSGRTCLGGDAQLQSLGPFPTCQGASRDWGATPGALMISKLCLIYVWLNPKKSQKDRQMRHLGM